MSHQLEELVRHVSGRHGPAPSGGQTGRNPHAERVLSEPISKAVRAIISSAFIIGLMDYCYTNDLPHPGFVVLDSPLTTKADRKKSDDDAEGRADEPDLIGGEDVSDEILTAFFTHLARNYTDRQVIIIDNKEPPDHLEGEIKHIRFNDPPLSMRKGLFPAN